MNIVITINTDNAAFRECPHIEVSRILDELAKRFCQLGIFEKEIMDFNGNTVGQVELFDNDISEKESIIPKILVTIKGGCYRYSSSNMPVELAIENLDEIALGNNLLYTCQTCETQEGFAAILNQAINNVSLLHIKEKAGDKPVNSVRIFIHDSEDLFPFNLMVNGEIVSTHKTFDEANEFLQEYLKAKKE